MKSIFKLSMIVKVLCALCICGIIGFATYKITSVKLTTSVTTKGNTIKYELNNIGILETAEYHYTHIETYDKDKMINNIVIPFTNSACIYSYDGVVTAGLDFSQIDIERRDNTIIVKLPPASIQNSSVDENSFMLYDEKSSIFNPLGFQDYNASLTNMKQTEEQNAIEKGLLEWANDNAKTLIRGLLASTYSSEEYEIVFE